MADKKVREVMAREVVTVTPTTTVHDAAALLAKKRISGAPVVENGRVVGVLTEADLVYAAMPPAPRQRGLSILDVLTVIGSARPRPHHEGLHVADVMSGIVVAVEPDATIWEAARLMQDRGVKRLPVITREDQLVGLLSRADIVRAVARDDSVIREDVFGAIEVLGDDVFEGLDVRVSEGVATLVGKADRRSTHDIAVRLASRVPGVLEVADRMTFEIDDRKLPPVVTGYGDPRRDWHSAEEVGSSR